MKKLIACLLGALMLVSVAVTPVNSTLVVKEKNPTVVMIDDFYTQSLTDLMEATIDLKKGDTLEIYSQGPGGNAFVMLSIMQWLEQLKARGVYIKTTVAGLVASANAFVFLMGDERVMTENDLMMLHCIQIRNKYGQILEIKDMDDTQKKIKLTIDSKVRQLLLDLTRDVELVNRIMRVGNDVWFDGTEALEAGLITKLI